LTNAAQYVSMRGMGHEDILLRDATPADWPAVLMLNADSVEHLSPMDEPRLRALAGAACYFRVAVVNGAVAGFLLAFRKGASYDGAIFQLFNERASDFVYIDRIVVGPEFRGHHIASRLYDDVAEFARASDAETLTCEVNVVPPNPASSQFHAQHGFHEIGRHKAGEKTVALLAREL
jgi:predicted GNAT superfamily acetyltransferase